VKFNEQKCVKIAALFKAKLHFHLLRSGVTVVVRLLILLFYIL